MEFISFVFNEIWEKNWRLLITAVNNSSVAYKGVAYKKIRVDIKMVSYPASINFEIKQWSCKKIV